MASIMLKHLNPYLAAFFVELGIFVASFMGKATASFPNTCRTYWKGASVSGCCSNTISNTEHEHVRNDIWTTLVMRTGRDYLSPRDWTNKQSELFDLLYKIITKFA